MTQDQALATFVEKREALLMQRDAQYLLLELVRRRAFSDSDVPALELLWEAMQQRTAVLMAEAEKAAAAVTDGEHAIRN